MCEVIMFENIFEISRLHHFEFLFATCFGDIFQSFSHSVICFFEAEKF